MSRKILTFNTRYGIINNGKGDILAASKYYDGTKLLSMKDINGNKPEIFICTSNRSAGKTTYFKRLLINRWKDSGDKFCLIYRYNYELDDLADKFFKSVKELFFPEYDMTAERRASGKYYELFLSTNINGKPEKKSCGYAISLNSADQIKNYSHLLSDTKRMLFDEFQSETNNYCPNEISKFISVHTSIARGGGEQVKYVPVYMLSNPVSIINPYYIELGITDKLKAETKFLRGNGFVLEQGYVESASLAQRQSAFNRAFQDNKYVEYAAQNTYLNDNMAFIDQPEGQSKYLCTLRYNGTDFAVREYPAAGIIYCDKRADTTFGMRLSVTTDDHNVNYVMLKRAQFFIDTLRYFFDKGCFRFKDLQCKEAILKTLSY